MGGNPPVLAPPTGRPAGPPPQPVIATTGNARVDSVLATLDATIAPFTTAPPPEQGAAGWVAQGLGGVLGVVNAPMMFIDAAASQGVSAILDALGLSGLFPPMPVATIGLSMHIGTPHTHVHPPSLVPPAPPIPLPSLGVAFLAGSASVLVGGVPALRAGDIGIGFTCGSAAPPFEIMTGASGVYFAGARVARLGMDITFHCNPASPMGGFAIGMGVAGVVAGAAGAAAQASAGNSGAAIAQGIQAGLDAAAMAVSMLRGKDPAGPPGVGMLIGPPMGNVMAGGPPIPNVGALAQGKIYSALGRALKSMRGRLRRTKPADDANGRTCDGGEPIHVVTGENYNTYLDFASLLGGFRWARYCSSADHMQRGVLGWGWQHSMQSELTIRLHRITLQTFQGEEVVFPRLRRTDEVVMHGYRLRRITDDVYVVSHRRHGELTFRRDGRGSTRARLIAIRSGDVQVELTYDRMRRVSDIVERGRHNDVPRSATYSVKYDAQGHVSEVWGSWFGEPPQRLAQYQYDAGGHLVWAHDADGKRDGYRYDALHRMVHATDRNGYSFSWEYDHEGRCARTQGEDGLWFAEFTYEPGLTTMKIHDGSAYEFEYDEDGVITQVTGPCGSVKKRLRDLEGRVVAEVDDSGRRIDFVYDDDGALVARRNGFGREFPPSAEQSGVPRTLGRQLPADARGFAFGRALGGPRPPAPALVERDRLGNVVYEKDSAGRERRWTYDAAGYRTSRTDRDGRTYREQVVRWGLVGVRVDPLGQATHYEYNPHQKITRVIDPGGSDSRYTYDSHDRVVQVERAGAVHERYVWDKAHRLVEKQDGQGETLLSITRHDNGLVGRIERRDGGWSELDYDIDGHAVRADTADHEVRRAVTFFDEIALEDCDGRTIVHEYGTDGLVDTTIADRFHQQRDRHGDHLELVDCTGRRRVVRWDAEGSVFIDHGNGSQEAHRYDGEGRLLGRATARRRAPGDEFWNEWKVAYEYTAQGDLVARRDTVRGDHRYTMDAAHRLVQVAAAHGTQLDYRYDAAGNLVENPRTGRVRLERGNRLHAAAAESFGYDERGRLTTRQTTAGTGVRYVYDDEDQLVRVEDGDEPWTATYDALGRRVTFGRGAARTRLWWDGDRVAAREDPDGSFRIFQYADPTSLTPLSFVDYDSVDADPSSGRSYSVFSDQVGLPQHIEDEHGAIVWWADDATPYGEVFVRPGNAIDYHLRFPGHVYDPDLQLHYNRFRDYDPRLGRYLQADPLGIRGGVNLYAYTPNPLVSVDVLGLAPGHDNSENGAPKGEEGEGRPLDDDPNATDADPPMRLTREEAEAKARAAADEHRAEVKRKFDAGELEGFDPNDPETLPPACVAGVVDQRTGKPQVAHNQPSGADAAPVNPKDYHPVLRERIKAQQKPEDGQTGHPSQPGSHAEVLALDKALKARDAAAADDPSIPPASEDNLHEFTQHPMWSRDPPDKPHMPPGGPAACCGNCAAITQGTNNTTGTAKPWVWRDGGWHRQ